MPTNYYINEGNKIASSDASALGTSVKQIVAGGTILKGQPLMISDDFEVVVCDDTHMCVGFAENAASAGDNVVILTEGFVKMDVGASAISAGAVIGLTSAGKAITVAAGQYAVGYAVSDGLANGTVYVKVLLDVSPVQTATTSKATGAEVITGTDDAKFVTAKALADSNYLATPAAVQADSTATEVAGLVTDFNALLAKLIAAGLMDAE